MWGSKPQIIVVPVGNDMSDTEVLQAFAVGPETPWFRAVVQEIENLRVDAIAAASAHGAKNNPLAMAGAVGAHETLTTLINNLNALRSEGSEE
jgi:hypothetical protein